MNHLSALQKSVARANLAAIVLPGLLGIITLAAIREVIGLSLLPALIIALAIFAGAAVAAHHILTKLVMSPISNVWQAVWYVSPNKTGISAPKLDDIRFGRELVSALALQIYELASHGTNVSQATSAAAPEPSTAEPVPVPVGPIADSIPLPLFFLDKDRVVKVANSAALSYVSLPPEKVIGRQIVDVLRMSFMTEDTFEKWLDGVANSKATDRHAWEHVRINLDESTVKQFDLAASYSKDKSDGLEIAMALFDQTATYDKQDQASSYVAMAVHELRTPLTIMRGYLEVFEDELGPALSAEHREFMRKMNASAQGLTAFVSNILNIARIDQNQFVMSLHEADWNEVLPQIIKDMEIRAAVRQKTLELEIEPNLPKVAIDRISVYEVVSNLIDNAIKYSGNQGRIVIRSNMGKDGNIETTVQDFGVGMPQSVIEGLFTRYHRSHRTKNAVSGSGLGLYLVKAIIGAHGGNVWVNSHEGEGSTFGFSLQPYSNMADSKAGSPDGIERQASGWIKNHSMYRR